MQPADWCLSALLAFMLLAAVVAAVSRDLLAAGLAGGAALAAASAGFLVLGAPGLALANLGAGAAAAALLARPGMLRGGRDAEGVRGELARTVGLVAAGILLTACAVVYAQRGPGRGLNGLRRTPAAMTTDLPADGGGRVPAAKGARPSERPGGPLVPGRADAAAPDGRGYDMLLAAAVFLAGVVGVRAVLGRRPPAAGVRRWAA